MARYSGSSLEGGAAAVQTVNGIAPIGGDVTLTASDIPSTDGNVQGDHDLLAASVATSVKTIESWADFALYATEAPAGTWTFDTILKGAGSITIPPNNKIVSGENGSLAGMAPLGLTFIGDIDDVIISGPLVAENVTVVQTNLGASARCIDIDSTAGRSTFLTNVAVIGGRVGVRFVNVDTVSNLAPCIAQNCDVGFQISGTVASVTSSGCAAVSGAANALGVEVLSTATITGSIVWREHWSDILAPTQYGFAISHNATFSGSALMLLSGPSNSGPQGNMVRQTNPGVTDMAIDDDRLVIKGGPSVANWLAAAVASRFDLGDPIIVDTSTAGAGVNTIIPYEDGAGLTEIVASIESHFTLFKGVSPLDWYFEYTGPLTSTTARLTSDILADRASQGPSGSILSWERAPFLDPGHGAFAPVPDSEIPWVNENRYKARTGTAISQGTNTFDRFRPVISDDSATDVRLGDIKLDLAIGS